MPAIIEKLSAHISAPPKPVRPLRALPSRLTARAMVETLDQLGCVVPFKLGAAGSSLRREDFIDSNFKVSLKELDAKLAASGLGISDRLRFKFALDSAGLIEA